MRNRSGAAPPRRIFVAGGGHLQGGRGEGRFTCQTRGYMRQNQGLPHGSRPVDERTKSSLQRLKMGESEMRIWMGSTRSTRSNWSPKETEEFTGICMPCISSAEGCSSIKTEFGEHLNLLWKVAEKKAWSMEEEVSKLQKCLLDKDEQLCATTGSTQKYLHDLDELRSRISVTQATTEGSAASAKSAESQCLFLLKELNEKDRSLKEHELRVNKLGEQIDGSSSMKPAMQGRRRRRSRRCARSR